jgi:hypothetical protein
VYKKSTSDEPAWAGSCSLQLPLHAGSSLVDFYTLKMEAIRSYETSVNKISTRRHIPEDGILHSHRRENLKSPIYLFALYILYKEHTKHSTLHAVEDSLLLAERSWQPSPCSSVKSVLFQSPWQCCFTASINTRNTKFQLHETTGTGPTYTSSVLHYPAIRTL